MSDPDTKATSIKKTTKYDKRLNKTKSYRNNSATQYSGSAMFFCYVNVFMFGRDEPLVEHKVVNVQEHLCSTPCLVWFVLLGFLCIICSTIVRLILSFDHCIDCLSSTYGFWLPLW